MTNDYFAEDSPVYFGAGPEPADDSGAAAGQEKFEATITGFVEQMRKRYQELSRLLRVTQKINSGVILDEILQFVYEEIRSVIPFNRIGFSLIDEANGLVVARWAHSDKPMNLVAGYSSPLAGSTLQTVFDTGQPRIISDLESYAKLKPESDSTQRILKEGLRSSLTCPLIVEGAPVGFLFFSSAEPNTYNNAHVEFYQQIAGQLSVIVEKGRLYSQLAEKNQIIEQQNLAMLRELNMARRLQQSLIPTAQETVPGLDLAFCYEPASQIGGDIIDFVDAGDGRLLVLVADAMGHGVEAALVMSATKGAFRAEARGQADPAAILTAMNHSLARMLSEQFVTAVCALIDPGRQSMTMALAGHHKPVHLCQDDGRINEPGEFGTGLGMVEDSEYVTVEVALKPNDLLVFCTDGLLEAVNAGLEQYGNDRLIEQVRQHADSGTNGLLEAIRSDLATHCGPQKLEDDLTIVVVGANSS